MPELYKTKPWFEITQGDEIPVSSFTNKKTSQIQARPCTTGIIKGKAKVFKEFYLPDNTDFDILVAKNTDPGWTPLIGLAKGLIIEHGGILSHAAIVSRELGIPCIVGTKIATQVLRDGDFVEVDAEKGIVTKL